MSQHTLLSNSRQRTLSCSYSYWGFPRRSKGYLSNGNDVLRISFLSLMVTSDSVSTNNIQDYQVMSPALCAAMSAAISI